MGFLDGTSITVDAVLTKKGREIIKNGQALDIVSFTASDTGVDYRLWNADHPSGSAYYGEAIENLPMLEASVHADQAIRNRLITLPQNTIRIPALTLDIPGTDNSTVTFEDNDTSTLTQVIATLRGFADNQNTRLYAVITQPGVVNIPGARAVQEMSGIHRQYINEANIDRAMVYEINASQVSGNSWPVGLAPDTTQRIAGRETNIVLIEEITGAYNSLKVVNNVTRLHRNMLGSQDNVVGD